MTTPPMPITDNSKRMTVLTFHGLHHGIRRRGSLHRHETRSRFRARLHDGRRNRAPAHPGRPVPADRHIPNARTTRTDGPNRGTMGRLLRRSRPRSSSDPNTRLARRRTDNTDNSPTHKPVPVRSPLLRAPHERLPQPARHARYLRSKIKSQLRRLTIPHILGSASDLPPSQLLFFSSSYRTLFTVNSCAGTSALGKVAKSAQRYLRIKTKTPEPPSPGVLPLLKTLELTINRCRTAPNAVSHPTG